MRRAHARLAVVAVLGAAIAACGGGAEQTPPAAAPSTPAPEPAPAPAPAPTPTETAAAAPTPPPPPPELPASYVAAQNAQLAQLEKLGDLFTDDKAACGKIADGITKFLKDPDQKKVGKTFSEEHDKLTPEQKAEVDKSSWSQSVDVKFKGITPALERCKADRKFQLATIDLVTMLPLQYGLRDALPGLRAAADKAAAEKAAGAKPAEKAAGDGAKPKK